MKRVWGMIRHAYDTYRMLRWTLWIAGVLAGIAGVTGAALMGYANRIRAGLYRDAPEYAADTRIDPLHMTSILSGINPAAWWGSIIGDGRLPLVIGIPLLLILLRLLTLIPLGRPDNPYDRDPRRLFSDADETWIRDCARGRCEHRSLLGLWRCRASYAHGDEMHHDHHYPWSKGGATGRHNLVLLCKKHNLKKSDRLPRFCETWLLYRARLRYFPARWRAYAWPDGKAVEGDAHSGNPVGPDPDIPMDDGFDDDYYDDELIMEADE
ncbi:HNH endonuclease [Bifidobacterium sp. SO1]|nr:HNH endonuclease [Bifidobacterium sp. SO1]